MSLGVLILRHTDNLSRTMQRTDMSVIEGQEVMHLTLSTLKSLRNDSGFDQKICASCDELDIQKPTLPCRRKVPRRLDDGAAPTFHDTVEEHYRVTYF